MTPLTNIQNDVAARLGAVSFFQYTPIEVIRELATASDIAQAMSCLKRKNERAGTALLVFMANLTVPNANPTGPICEGRITVRAVELPKTNSSGVTAEEIALKCLDALHLFDPGYLGGPLRTVKEAVMPSVEAAPRLIYDVTFGFPLPLDQTGKPATPRFTQAGGEVEISCATSGAAIRYTTDGTYPTEEAGTLYGAALSGLDAGTRVRAVAYKAGLQGSNCAEVTTG